MLCGRRIRRFGDDDARFGRSPVVVFTPIPFAVSRSHGTWKLAAAATVFVAVAAAAGTAPTFAGPSGRVTPTTVTDVHYGVDDGAALVSVSFTVDPAGAALVRASVDGATWHDCAVAGARATCDLGATAIAGVRTLRVQAID
jgi:hypothetical protein